MVKQNGSFFGRLFKKIFLLSLFALFGVGGYLAWQHRDNLPSALDFGLAEDSITTFELAYSPEQIMQKHKSELLRTSEHSFGKAYVQFVPLLLMNVKYTQDNKTTQEAECLWNLQTGEMILDTSSFETTHGFEDCINSKASQDDFRILHAILRKGGSITKEQLAQELGLDSDELSSRLEVLRKKHLIVQKLETITLHFQNPRLLVVPRTKISQSFVQKVVASGSQASARYSKDEIQKVAKAAFGQDFAIRSAQEVYVPIVGLEVCNPDGSTLKVFYNGITSKKLL